jgi:hypothetical protein
MSDSLLREQRDASIALLDGLIRTGRELLNRDKGVKAPPSLFAAVSIWQRDCAAAVNELSGGSKAHWLSRAYSAALLVRAADGEAVVEADVVEIVFRVLDVLDQGRRSIAGADAAALGAADQQQPRRFEFVHDAELRPVLEQALVDSRQAFEAGEYERSLLTTCGILEAIITDALKVRLKPDATADLSDLSFDARIAAAETAALIRGGCARLPAVARAYRDPPPRPPITERDAKIARQVLHVVMRDLDPGR